MFKKAELTPFSELPPYRGTLQLPDYVPTERIGVNLPLLANIAGWACCQPLVKLDMYSGKTTQYDPSITGMTDDGSAMMGLSAKQDKSAPLARHAFSELDRTNHTDNIFAFVEGLHQVPKLHIQYNIAEMDNRLSQANAVRREPKPWVDLLNQGARMAIGAASREHLLRGGSKAWAEANFACQGVAISLVVGAMVSLMLKGEFTAPVEYIPMYAVSTGTAAKMLTGIMNGINPHGVCASLIPAFHLDRLLAANVTARNRRIFQVLPPGTARPDGQQV